MLDDSLHVYHDLHRLHSVSVTVPVVGPRLRQICQYCGSFYNLEANTNVSLRRSADGGLVLPAIVS